MGQVRLIDCYCAGLCDLLDEIKALKYNWSTLKSFSWLESLKNLPMYKHGTSHLKSSHEILLEFYLNICRTSCIPLR